MKADFFQTSKKSIWQALMSAFWNNYSVKTEYYIIPVENKKLVCQKKTIKNWKHKLTYVRGRNV